MVKPAATTIAATATSMPLVASTPPSAIQRASATAIGAHVALASLLSDAEARAGVSERLRTLAYRLDTGEEPLDAAAALMSDLEDRFTRLAETIAVPVIGWWSAHG